MSKSSSLPPGNRTLQFEDTVRKWLGMNEAGNKPTGIQSPVATVYVGYKFPRGREYVLVVSALHSAIQAPWNIDRSFDREKAFAVASEPWTTAYLLQLKNRTTALEAQINKMKDSDSESKEFAKVRAEWAEIAQEIGKIFNDKSTRVIDLGGIDSAVSVATVGGVETYCVVVSNTGHR